MNLDKYNQLMTVAPPRILPEQFEGYTEEDFDRYNHLSQMFMDRNMNGMQDIMMSQQNDILSTDATFKKKSKDNSTQPKDPQIESKNETSHAATPKKVEEVTMRPYNGVVPTLPSNYTSEQRKHASNAWWIATEIHKRNPKVDPRIVFAMFVYETGHFKSTAAKGYNYGGWKVPNTRRTNNPKGFNHSHSLFNSKEEALEYGYRSIYAPDRRQGKAFAKMGSNVNILGQTLGPKGSYYFGGPPERYQSAVIKFLKQFKLI